MSAVTETRRVVVAKLPIITRFCRPARAGLHFRKFVGLGMSKAIQGPTRPRETADDCGLWWTGS